MVSQNASSPDTRWHLQRHWYMPRPHRLLHHATNGMGTTQMACQLLHPGLAYLWQHRVAGRALFPGAAMLELALAAISSLSGGDSQQIGNDCS